MATARHWPSHLRLSAAFLRRLRRFSFFLILGYTLHMPVQSVPALWHLDPVAWRGFVAVDVLQLIGATFITIQFLVLICRSRAVFAVACLVLAAIPTGRWGGLDFFLHRMCGGASCPQKDKA